MNEYHDKFLAYAEICSQVETLDTRVANLTQEKQDLSNKLESALLEIDQLNKTFDTFLSIQSIWKNSVNG